MIKVLIADDHQLIREGFKIILEREVDLKVIGEARNGEEILEFLHRNLCDVVVLDISMPGKSGLDILKELSESKIDCKVLVLSMHPEERFAVRALRSGASGYITKESAPEQLVDAIRKIYSGGRYISPELAEQLVYDLSREQGKLLHTCLSDREFEVLCQIGRGKSSRQISSELDLSLSTVNTYRKRIMEKMNLSTNAEIIHYVVKHNLID